MSHPLSISFTRKTCLFGWALSHVLKTREGRISWFLFCISLLFFKKKSFQSYSENVAVKLPDSSEWCLWSPGAQSWSKEAQNPFAERKKTNASNMLGVGSQQGAEGILSRCRSVWNGSGEPLGVRVGLVILSLLTLISKPWWSQSLNCRSGRCYRHWTLTIKSETYKQSRRGTMIQVQVQLGGLLGVWTIGSVIPLCWQAGTRPYWHCTDLGLQLCPAHCFYWWERQKERRQVH